MVLARQKMTDFPFAHFRRMTFFVEKEKPLDPMNVRLLGHVAVVSRSDCGPYLVEQLGFRR
jgi:hypothetical protein